MTRYLVRVSLLLIGLTGWSAFGAAPVLIAPKWDDPSTPANGEARPATMTPDGRYILFWSSATDLVPVDTNGSVEDMFLYDRIAGTVDMIVPTADGTQPTAGCFANSISADGRYVAFDSNANGLLPGLSGNLWRSYVYDRQDGTLELVGVADDGTPADPMGTIVATSLASMSIDGRYVCFYSRADNLVSGDTNGVADVFVRDRQTGHTERVSLDTDGSELAIQSTYASMTPDGRYVSFTCPRTDVSPPDVTSRVFVRDRATHTSELVNLDLTGSVPANESSMNSAPMSGDGRFVLFFGVSDTFVDDDTNGTSDLFLRDRVAETTEIVSYDLNGQQFTLPTYCEGMSADARFVTYYWTAFSGLTSYLRDRTAHTVGSPGADGWLQGMSANGRFLPLTKHYIHNEYRSLYLWEPQLVEYGTTAGTVTDADTGAPIAGADVWIGGCLLTITGDDGSYSIEVVVTPDTSVKAEADSYASATTTGIAIAAGETTTANLALTSQPFPDVDPDFWAAPSVLSCVNAGIVSGYDDGLYHPEYAVTRDQMAVYISRALAGGDENVPDFTDTPTFPDVPGDNWALDYIEYAVEQAVVTGYDDGLYHPADEVTRDQMAVYVARALVAPTGEAALLDYVPSDPRNFPDVLDTFWAYKHIEYCAESGVVQGYLDGMYHPEVTVTRDQMAVYVARAFGL